MSDPGVSGYAFDRRAASRQRAAAVQGKIIRTAGTVVAGGSGEGLVDVSFPNQYVEVPTMSFGGELGVGSPMTGGSFPTVSVIVHHWNTEDRSLGTLYVGATLIIVTTGVSGQTIIVHWQAEGRALSSPMDLAAFNSTGTA